MSRSNHYDVIVVGAGPAGNSAAWTLAKAGAKVALLEKQKLPRHKTCGGGMPMVVADFLQLEILRDLSADAFVESDTRFMRHTWKFGDPYLAPMNPEPEEGAQEDRQLSLWMVQRHLFDNALAQRAAGAGAELLDELGVRSIESSQEEVRVRAESKSGAWEATCDTLIGADGANGIVARSVGLRRDRTLVIAIEAEVPHRWGDGDPELRPDVAHIEYGAVERGYAWVFPKRDHLNVGAGVFRPRREDGRGDNSVRNLLQTTILDYLKALGVPRRSEELHYYAHPLPIWNGLDRLQSEDNRVLLAGDAAGLINPLFGDGILHALKSGRIAAEAILSGNAAGYTRAIGDEFQANFDAALTMSRFFYQWTGFCYKHGVIRPGATRMATRLLCGDALFTNVAARAIKRIRKEMRSSVLPNRKANQ